MQVGILQIFQNYLGRSRDEDIVQVRSDTLDRDQTWAPLGAVYRIHEDVSVAAGLTLDPGVTLVFEQERKLTVEDGGRLSAVGSAAAPIVFTGEEAVRGYWAGLVFDSSGAAENRLENVTIEYGGGMGQLDEETKASMHPRWIAPVVTYLASAGSAGVTGRVFQVSGRELAVAEGWHKGPSSANTDDPTEVGAIVESLVADARPNADMFGNDKAN